MNLSEISLPSDTRLLESFQNDPSGFPASLLLEFYRAYTDEAKQTKKPKGYGLASTSSNQLPTIAPRGEVVELRMAGKTIANLPPAILANYRKFVEFKTANPTSEFPGGDKRMIASAPFGRAVPGIAEADLNDDMHVIYVTRPTKDEKNMPVVKVFVFGIFSHKDLGIGNNRQPRINDQMADRFKNAMM
jgi:hypothetical protein